MLYRVMSLYVGPVIVPYNLHHMTSSTADGKSGRLSSRLLYFIEKRLLCPYASAHCITMILLSACCPICSPFPQYHGYHERPAIPSIFPCVFLEDKGPFEHYGNLNITFGRSLAVYSAHLCLNLDKIYINTNNSQHFPKTLNVMPPFSHVWTVCTLRAGQVRGF